MVGKSLKPAVRPGGRVAPWLVALVLLTNSAAAEDATPSSEVKAFEATPSGEVKASEVRQRAYLLQKYLEPTREAAFWETYGGAIYGGLAAGIGIGMTILQSRDIDLGPSTWPEVGVLGAVALVGASTYVVPEELRYPLVRDVMILGLTPATLGVWIAADPVYSQADRISGLITSATGGVTAGLALVDAMLKPRVSNARLKRHLFALIGTQGTISAKQLEVMERDFERMDRPIPEWVSPSVRVLGGLLALVPLAKEPVGANWIVPAGLLVLPGMFGILKAVTDNGYRGYAHALKDFRLAPVGPQGTAGATLGFRF
jgi:hypothetical protein